MYTYFKIMLTVLHTFREVQRQNLERQTEWKSTIKL